MRCTKCSHVIKPVVGIDIDGTLGNYHLHFERFAREWLGFPEGLSKYNYDGSIRYRDWFTSAYNVSTEVFRTIKLAYRQGGQKRTMPVYNGASQLTKRLQDHGVEVWLCTTRPYLRLDSIDPDTQEWVRRNAIFFDHLLYGPNKYKRLSELVDFERVVAVLDDDSRHLAEATEIGYTGILRRTSYNSSCDHPYIATSLFNASDLIMMGVKRWIELHHEEPLLSLVPDDPGGAS
jgi:hypothetical protein